MRTTATIAAMFLSPFVALAQEPSLPPFDAGAFTAPKANAYFPLEPGTRWRMAGSGTDEGETVTEEARVIVTGPGPVILGVQTVQLLDEEWKDGLLTERTFDFVATDDLGNVWYFGEDVTNYEYDGNGALTARDTDASWRAGEAGALPGILIPGAPVPGLSLFIGQAPEAGEMDYFEVASLDEAVVGPTGTYTGVLKLRGGSTLEPDDREFKFYARDVGLIREEDGLSEAMDEPEFIGELQP